MSRVLFIICLLPVWFLSCSEAAKVSDHENGDKIELDHPLPEEKVKANVVKLRQSTLPERDDEFRIPNLGDGMDYYKQKETIYPLVDILIVIDNSGSMGEEQAKLADKMQALITELTYVDWQINVITTDSPCPTKDYLPLKSSAADPDVKKKFKDAIQIGTDGNSTERPLLMAKMHLSGQPLTGKNCEITPWLRKEASLVLFFLTDEDEITSDSSSPSKENADSIIKFLTDDPVDQGMGKVIGKTVKLYSIHSLPEKPCSSAGGVPSLVLADLIKKTDGYAGDICASDYSGMLSTISEDIANLFRVAIELMFIPAKGTAFALLDGETYDPNFWKIEGSYFILLNALAENQELYIYYKKGVTNDLVLLSKDVAPIEVKVFRGEPGEEPVEVDTSEYTYFPAQKQVHFFTALTPGLVVNIKYKNAAELRTDFDFPVLESAEDIYCYDEDDNLIPHTYYPRDNVILFDKAPKESSVVTCLFP